MFGDGANGGGVSLAQCLAAHTRDETLSGAGRYYCERCADVGGATKQTKLQTLPPVLCLHLKRFTWRGAGVRRRLTRTWTFRSTRWTSRRISRRARMRRGRRIFRAGRRVEAGRPGGENRASRAGTRDRRGGGGGDSSSSGGGGGRDGGGGVGSRQGARDGAQRRLRLGRDDARTRRNSSGALDAAAQDAAAAKAAAAEEAAQQAREAAAVAMASWIDRSGSDDPEGAGPPLYDLAAAVVHHGPGPARGTTPCTRAMTTRTAVG